MDKATALLLWEAFGLLDWDTNDPDKLEEVNHLGRSIIKILEFENFISKDPEIKNGWVWI